ncbi:hypothetical protein FB45DRAFT_516876 [Roridomyces roridus]|uniref:Cupredoxin n=1 Tax=Roridomyces roridus TaxID=1738132 RepID=A0AAD7BX60_9AGAR|nr:hypothetical protein FB45DRAFT_516876 [Roridomyces roridus]
MRFSLAVAAIAAPVLSVVAQQNILVTVGANALLAFNPPNITANNGDTVTFQFQSKNHSVTQSTFADPCSIATAPQGIDSGFQLVAANATELPEWSFTITNASAPLWFFCAQTVPANHCHAGMVFSVNAKEGTAKSFEAYQASAKALANSAAAPSAGGAAPAASGGAAPAASGGAAPAASGGAPAASGGASPVAASGGAGAAPAPSGGASPVAGASGAPVVSGPSGSDSAVGAAATGGSNSTAAPPNAAGRVTSSAVSMLAAVGLAAMLL